MHIVTKLLHDMRLWLFGTLVICLILYVFAGTTNILFGSSFIKIVGLGTTGITLIKGIVQYRNIKKGSADISISKYLRVPDYNAKLGFVHFAEEDLQRVLDLITKPIVIFIDDLDRCSPDKVAALTEAINLFLAGEFKNCIFVLGMDSEIIAASLE